MVRLLKCIDHRTFLIKILPLANALGAYGAYTTSTFDRLETWLRGGWYTDANGIVEVATIYPGYYDGRAPHIHIMVHKDWVQSANGCVVPAISQSISTNPSLQHSRFSRR